MPNIPTLARERVSDTRPADAERRHGPWRPILVAAACLGLASAAFAGAPRTAAVPSKANENAFDRTVALAVDATIGEALDELGLLAPGIEPDRALDLLGELFVDEHSVEQAKGSPAFGYVAHRKWGVGGADGYGLDQFAGSPSGTYRARAAARLANGDVVVVGDIQGGGVSADRSLGLVKFNKRGQRVPWSDVASQYSHHQDQYIRFPGSSDWGTNRQVVAVHDVQVSGSNIYALITYSESGQRRAAILIWRENGSHVGWYFAAPDSGAVRDAVAMDIHGSHLIVLGRRSLDINDTNGGYWTVRATINSNGSLSIGAITNFSTTNRIIPADIAFSRPALLAPVASPAYYVAYTVRHLSSSATWPCIGKVTSGNAIDTSFGTNGFRCNAFDALNGGEFRDWAVALHTRPQLMFGGGGPVQREVLHMSAVVNQTRADSIGLVKLVAGEPDTSFGGSSGQRVYGGCDTSGFGEGCSSGPLFNDTAHVPLRGALYADSTGVYVSGRTYRQAIILGNPPSRRPIFMHVNEGSGALNSLQVFGTYPNSRFGALVPGAGAGGMREFTVVGYAHYEDTVAVDDGPTRFLTAHLVRGADLIFYDGLQ